MHCWDFVHTLHAHRTKNGIVEAMARFLEEDYDKEDLLMFLRLRKAVNARKGSSLETGSMGHLSKQGLVLVLHQCIGDPLTEGSFMRWFEGVVEGEEDKEECVGVGDDRSGVRDGIVQEAGFRSREEFSEEDVLSHVVYYLRLVKEGLEEVKERPAAGASSSRSSIHKKSTPTFSVGANRVSSGIPILRKSVPTSSHVLKGGLNKASNKLTVSQSPTLSHSSSTGSTSSIPRNTIVRKPLDTFTIGPDHVSSHKPIHRKVKDTFTIGPDHVSSQRPIQRKVKDTFTIGPNHVPTATPIQRKNIPTFNHHMDNHEVLNQSDEVPNAVQDIRIVQDQIKKEMDLALQPKFSSVNPPVLSPTIPKSPFSERKALEKDTSPLKAMLEKDIKVQRGIKHVGKGSMSSNEGTYGINLSPSTTRVEYDVDSPSHGKAQHSSPHKDSLSNSDPLSVSMENLRVTLSGLTQGLEARQSVVEGGDVDDRNGKGVNRKGVKQGVTSGRNSRRPSLRREYDVSAAMSRSQDPYIRARIDAMRLHNGRVVPSPPKGAMKANKPNSLKTVSPSTGNGSNKRVNIPSPSTKKRLTSPSGLDSPSTPKRLSPTKKNSPPSRTPPLNQPSYTPLTQAELVEHPWEEKDEQLWKKDEHPWEKNAGVLHTKFIPTSNPLRVVLVEVRKYLVMRLEEYLDNVCYPGKDLPGILETRAEVRQAGGHVSKRVLDFVVGLKKDLHVHSMYCGTVPGACGFKALEARWAHILALFHEIRMVDVHVEKEIDQFARDILKSNEVRQEVEPLCSMRIAYLRAKST